MRLRFAPVTLVLAWYTKLGASNNFTMVSVSAQDRSQLQGVSTVEIQEFRLPESVSARVSVGTARGKFESDFDLGGTKPLTGEVFSFTIGEGEVQIELVTYSGDIRLKVRKR